MDYRELAGNSVSLLGYGCMRLPTIAKSSARDSDDEIDQEMVNRLTDYTNEAGEIDEPRAEKLLLRAYEQGVNYFDTAWPYHSGKSEPFVGKVLSKLDRDSFYIATKLPMFTIESLEQAKEIFNTQLEHLQTDHVDYYLLHSLDEAKWQKVLDLGLLPFLEEQQRLGRIRKLGFSFHAPYGIFKRIIDYRNWDFCQIQFNYMDEHSQAGLRGLQYAAGKGLPVIIMEPLRGGRLVQGLPESAKRVFEKTTPKRSPAEWGLRWVWNHPEVTVILSGMNEIEQVEENVRIASEAKADSLTKEELEVFEQVKQEINKKIKVPCTGCAYCMPCPQGVDIPGCFSAYNMRYTDGWYAGFKTYFMCTTLRKNQTNASKCVGCGKCEQHCPQSIPIRQKLKEVRQHMEGPVYHVGRFVAKHTRKD